jgi:hypothetical protein
MQMELPNLLLGASLFCACWAVASYILLARSLHSRGVETPFPLLGLLLFRNLSIYSRLSKEETGRTGALLYSFVVPINFAMLLAVAGLVAQSIA